jgi:hypothetical protein
MKDDVGSYFVKRKGVAIVYIDPNVVAAYEMGDDPSHQRRCGGPAS